MILNKKKCIYGVKTMLGIKTFKSVINEIKGAYGTIYGRYTAGQNAVGFSLVALMLYILPNWARLLMVVGHFSTILMVIMLRRAMGSKTKYATEERVVDCRVV